MRLALAIIMGMLLLIPVASGLTIETGTKLNPNYSASGWYVMFNEFTLDNITLNGSHIIFRGLDSEYQECWDMNNSILLFNNSEGSVAWNSSEIYLKFNGTATVAPTEGHSGGGWPPEWDIPVILPIPPNVTCGYFIPITIPITGFYATEAIDQEVEFRLNINNWNIEQAFYGELSGELVEYCTIDESPQGGLPPFTATNFVFSCDVPNGTIGGFLNITTDTGCVSGFPVSITGVEEVENPFEKLYDDLSKTEFQALTDEISILGYDVPIWSLIVGFFYALLIVGLGLAEYRRRTSS